MLRFGYVQHQSLLGRGGMFGQRGFFFIFLKFHFVFKGRTKVLILLSLFQEGSIRIHNHVPAAHHTTVAPHNSGIHGYVSNIFPTLFFVAEISLFCVEKTSANVLILLSPCQEGGIRTFHSLFNGASAHRSMAPPNFPATHGVMVM